MGAHATNAGAGEYRIDDLRPLDARQFAVAVRKLANGLLYGLDRSPFTGSGIEYVQSRPWVDGDSVRAIDWRVTARTRKVHVKEFETPRSLPTWLLLDTSASMTVQSGPLSKYELAVRVAGGIAFACLDRVSPVGVASLGDRALRLQPSMSKVKVLEWMLALRDYRSDERTHLAARVRELATSAPQRSLVVVLSDLHEEGAVPALRALSQLHDVVALRFEDPAERGLRGAGIVRAREAEGGASFVARGAKLGAGDLERGDDELRRAGIDVLVLKVDQRVEAPLRNLFKNRGRTGQGTR